jgi:hypothetical protein
MIKIRPVQSSLAKYKIHSSMISHCDRRTVRPETYRDKSLIDVQYGQRHTVINHCDRRTVQSETYRDKSLIDVQYGQRHTVINH